MQWYICQGDMFRPSRSSSGPPRKQIQELQLLDLFSWRAWGWPTSSKHVALTYIPLSIKINVVLSTDVLCSYVITLRDGKLKKRGVLCRKEHFIKTRNQSLPKENKVLFLAFRMVATTISFCNTRPKLPTLCKAYKSVHFWISGTFSWTMLLHISRILCIAIHIKMAIFRKLTWHIFFCNLASYVK